MRAIETIAAEPGEHGPTETIATRAGPRLVVAALLCLVAAGALLWWHEGDAVFTSLVSGALAWCL